MDVPDAAPGVIAAALALGVDIDVREYPEGTRTAADAASAIGCETADIVKSLVFVVDERPVVALVPGDRRLDPARLAAALGGAAARPASLDEVRVFTGYAAGGTPPFGHARPLEVVADPALARRRRVWAAAGTATTVFPIDPQSLMAIAGGRWADICAP